MVWKLLAFQKDFLMSLTRLPINGLQFFQLLRFGTTLLIGILLAKVFGLATAEIALYEVILFLGNFVSFFWISASIKSLLSEYARSKNQTSTLLINTSFLLFIIGLIAAALLYFFQSFLLQSFTQFEQIPYLYLICLYLIFNAPAALIEYIYLLQKKEVKLIRYGVIIFSLQLGAVLLALIMNWGIAGIFHCLLLWSVIKFVWLVVVLAKHSKQSKSSDNDQPILNWAIQKRLLLLLFPLSLHMLIGGGMEYVDGFIVTKYFEDTGMFAIFRYGARELPLVTILTAALTATLIPLAVENQAIVLPKIKTEIDKLSRWLFPLTIILMLVSPYLFPFIYNENFAAAANVFNVYLLIISSRILLPQVIILAQQHNYVLVWSAFIEVVVNLGLSLYWVQDYGLEGIAFATVCAYFVNKIILISYNYFQFKIPLSDYLNVPKYVFYNLSLAVFFWISLYIKIPV